MKIFIWIVGVLALLVVGFMALNTSDYKNISGPVQVIPITHATMVLHWGETVIYTDPTGGVKAFEEQFPADIVVITDIHGDHLSTSTLTEVLGDAILVVPEAVKNLLPENLASRAIVLGNGETTTQQGLRITAIPMYNLPESPDNRHAKGRGNGYLFERDSFRVYVAGDTAGIPEMRTLKNIDMAFIPMNLPFTMGVEEAASAVLDFKPKQVYPFHYRGQDGLADIEKFKELVNAGNSNIEVINKDWYPEQ